MFLCSVKLIAFAIVLLFGNCQNPKSASNKHDARISADFLFRLRSAIPRTELGVCAPLGKFLKIVVNLLVLTKDDLLFK